MSAPLDHPEPAPEPKPKTFKELVGVWEASASVVMHPNVVQALERGLYGRRDVDALLLSLVRDAVEKVEARLPNQLKTTEEGELRDLAATLYRMSQLLVPDAPVALHIDPAILEEMTGLYGPDGVNELRASLREEADRQIREFRRRRDDAGITPGERYLRRHGGKAGYFYPYGAAGDLLHKFEERVSGYFGSQGLITNRLYDLLKVANVVPEPGEPWERSRARAVRVELHNAVCHHTLMRIVGWLRDHLVTGEYQTAEEVGRDFVDRAHLEGWLIDHWFVWMADAAERAVELGGFALEGRQFDPWADRVYQLFNYQGRGRQRESFTTDDALADLMQFCKDHLTEELLAKIPMRKMDQGTAEETA